MEKELNNEIMQTGTTTIGIVSKDAVVLAADMRTTAGGMIVNRKTDKIFEISEKAAVTMSGTVSDSMLLVKLIKAEISLKRMRANREPTIKEIANLLSGMVYNNIRKMSMIPGISHFVLGGYDESTGRSIYDIYMDGSITKIEDYVASGSGSVFALGVLETMYSKDLQTEEAIELAVKAINAALKRDTASGDGINVVVIDKEGVKPVKKKQLEINLSE